MGVREIRHRVREAKRDIESPAEGRELSFHAPLEFSVVFNQTIEAGRLVLGRDAPRYRAIEAILMESGLSGFGESQATPHRQHHPPEPFRRLPVQSVPVRPAAFDRAFETLRHLDQYLSDLGDLLSSGTSSSAWDALERLKQIHRLHAPLRVLLTRLVRSLREMRATKRLGFCHLGEFLAHQLGICERKARQLVSESYLFEDVPQLEAAYGRGAIGICKAELIRRLTFGRGVEPYLRRAQEVTYRHFDRECRFQDLLLKCDGRLAARFRGPLPQPGLEEAMVEELCCNRGWTEERLASEFARKQLGQLCPRETGSPSDPAESPNAMRRLEHLLELMVLALWDEPPDEIRQTSAGRVRQVRIRFWAPNEIVGDLLAAISQIRQEYGIHLPVWAALTVLFAQVSAEWTRHDPQSRPVRAKILDRDEYRCRFPGCTERCHLVVHHLVFASHGGDNAQGNLITLCHAHHNHVIHAGFARARGRAPDAITWVVGTVTGHSPLLVLKGDRIVSD